jgi:hypothetical protein
MVINDLKDQIPLREISRISGISLSGYYYKPVKRHIQRLDPSIKDEDQGHCIRKTDIRIQESVGNTEESGYNGESEDRQEGSEG